jgi:hypothetical protein
MGEITMNRSPARVLTLDVKDVQLPAYDIRSMPPAQTGLTYEQYYFACQALDRAEATLDAAPPTPLPPRVASPAEAKPKVAPAQPPPAAAAAPGQPVLSAEDIVALKRLVAMEQQLMGLIEQGEGPQTDSLPGNKQDPSGVALDSRGRIGDGAYRAWRDNPTAEHRSQNAWRGNDPARFPPTMNAEQKSQNAHRTTDALRTREAHARAWDNPASNGVGAEAYNAWRNH